MAYKTVIQLDLKCSKCKKVALHSVTKIEGIESVTINIPESTLTVIGDADPVCMIQLLKKKFCCVHLVCYGPWPPPEKPKPEKPKPETHKPETSASASATSTSTSTSTSTPTFILYNSPCNCRPPQTFPCTPPNNCPNYCPPACKPPKCCPPGSSCSACKPPKCPPKCCPPGSSCSACKPPKCCPPGLSCSACKPPKCCPPGLSCSCRLEKCCPTSCPCPNKSKIMWPQYHNPLAPDEVWYVWKEDQQESCIIM